MPALPTLLGPGSFHQQQRLLAWWDSQGNICICFKDWAVKGVWRALNMIEHQFCNANRAPFEMGFRILNNRDAFGNFNLELVKLVDYFVYLSQAKPFFFYCETVPEKFLTFWFIHSKQLCLFCKMLSPTLLNLKARPLVNKTFQLKFGKRYISKREK